MGVDAVDVLIEALEGGSDTVRARVMPVLALIRDPRGREPLIAMLLDRDSRLRAIAARSLARFPCADGVAALNRVLERDRSLVVKVAAIEALVQQYAGGEEQAIRLVLDRLVDLEQDSRLRIAALALLPALRPAQRRGVLNRLRDDPEESVRSRAREWVEPRDEPGSPEIDELLARLRVADYSTWYETVHQLAACGSRVIEPLVDEMRRRSCDPEYCARAGMALKALGPRRGRSIGDAMENTSEPIPLRVLVEVIGALGHKPTIYRLKSLIDRLSDGGSRDDKGFDPMDRVRTRAHLELARIGSRVAVDDLKQLLCAPRRRAVIELLAAVELIGKRDEIGPLLLAWQREDPFTRERIARVVRAIMRRERIRRNNRVFRDATAAQRRALEAILPPRRREPRGHRAEAPRLPSFPDK